MQMGYGARALSALNSFYSGEYFNVDESSAPEMSYPDPAAVGKVRYTVLTLFIVCDDTPSSLHHF